MGSSLSNSPRRSSNSFRKIVDVFFKQPGLPFAEVLTADMVEEVFRKHRSLFGIGAIYSTATVLWAFLGQLLQDGKMAACQAAVAGIIAHRQLLGQSTPTEDTGDYCRARAKLNEHALRELSCRVAQNTEAESDGQWLINGRHAKLVDGFTFTMPDTAKNQRKYPQAKTQKPGLGFPIARCVAILSLATACVLDLAIGPYAGKETGETALLRQLMYSFSRGDIAVFDRYYCTFMVIAAMLSGGTDVCCRKHHLRQSDFRRGKRLGKHDHQIIWHRPQKPKWMDEETYQSIPEQITLREVKLTITEPGFRTKSMIIITTLTDPAKFSKEAIAEIYGYRWNAELDIRSIKSNLNLEHLRCQSPEMVRRELWTTILGYNLIRSTATAAAMLHDVRPREISFTSTVQFVLQEWKQLSRGNLSADKLTAFIERMLNGIANCRVADRPGRIEPRVVKRRPKPYKSMMKPRSVLRKELMIS
jgi:hypothetical protein